MKKTTIADTCTLHARIGWQGLTTKEYLDDGEFYLVTGVDFDNGHIAFDSCHYVTRDRYDQDQHIQLQVDDILVTKDGTIGKVAFIDKPLDKPATLNSGVFVVRPKDKSTLLPKYLMYVLQSSHFNGFIEKIKVGCTIAHLNQEKFYQFQFPLPSVDEQHKIVSVFDAMLVALNARKMELRKLDELIKARFVEMFGDPINNPKGWTVKTIGELVTEVRYGTSSPAVEGGRYPYLRMNNLTYDGHIDLSDLKYIDVSENELEKCVVRKGDVLFNRTNSIELIGKTAVFDFDEDMVIAGYIIRVRLKEEMVPDVLSQYMNLEPIKMLLRNMAKGAVNQANINAQELQSIKVYVPDIALQRQFVEEKNQVDKSKVAVQKALNESQRLFDSLMQKYFG